ncbi:MAG: hypothetical protein PHF44_01300 [Candidatus Pacebacteria bacterium]|nr:hypothetical protein [Candidatus Paceibacterota bacterium]
MKRIRNTVVLQEDVRVGNLRLKTTFYAKIVFQGFERWDDGIKTAKNSIGRKPPACCGEFPEKNGLFLCDCGKHLIRISDNEVKGSKIYFREVVKLPKNLLK